jgi:hypothetical protein
MAKSARDELFETLRARGLRSRAAKLASDAMSTGTAGAGKGQAAVRALIADLRKAADDLEDRLTGGKSKSRSEAAKKAARTRARKASQRSASAKKAAATRKKSTSTTARKSTARKGTSTRSRARAKS